MPRSKPIWAVGVIALAILAAYANSLRGAFVFDDWIWLDSTAAGKAAGLGAQRLIPRLTYALNFWMSGDRPWSYHLFNVGIHFLTAVTLYGLARLTLQRPIFRGRCGSAADGLALAIAVLWAIHPLNTASVDYISQRTELLMGLCYLLTLYCFARGAAAEARGFWLPLAVVACVAGMASKEVMVTAPALVLLYDRTFIVGSFPAAWAKRRGFYAALAGSWLVLIVILFRGLRTQSVGFDYGVSAWTYALTASRTLWIYLGLTVWPRPLVFDYGQDYVSHFGAATPYIFATVGMLIGLGALLARRPLLAFAGCWWIGILAPTTSVIPIAEQPVAENRLYLPLMAVVSVLVVGTYGLLGRRAGWLGLAIALALGGVTLRRNPAYRSEVSIWADTVAKRPENARARNALGVAYLVAGQPHAAVLSLEEATRLQPDYAPARRNLAAALAAQRTLAGQINNRANDLMAAGRPADAWVQYRDAVQLQPEDAPLHKNLAMALYATGHLPEAVQECETALRLDPADADAANKLGHLRALLAARSSQPR